MNDIQLNSELFKSRCAKIASKLDVPLLILLGKSSDVQDFNMNSALFYFLLGYEFPETIVIIQKDPIIITSPKKAIILQQIENLKILIKNKDASNIDSLLDTFSGVYGVIEMENIKGELASKIFSRVRTKDVTAEILDLLSVKEPCEMDYIYKSGIISNYLLQKGVDLIRDNDFSRENLEKYMDDRIRGINNGLIEFSSEPEFSKNHLRFGIRYRGYCTEIGRSFLTDLSAEYDIQKHVLSIVKPNVLSTTVLESTRAFVESKGYSNNIKLYNIGLMCPELDFSTGFVIKNGMCFCLNIDDSFCNTFVLNDIPIFVTKKDTVDDYSTSRMRFRNKSNDLQLITKIKEHQKELLDLLIEERLNFYKTHHIKTLDKKTSENPIVIYEKDSVVPRAEKPYLDWDRFFVLIPILSYSVPFHISTIKNVSIVNFVDEPRLRINFKDSKEIKEAVEVEKEYDTKLKFLTLRCGNVEELVSQINEMRKEFSKPKVAITTQTLLKEKFKKYTLSDVYLRTDNKGANKKTLANLEIHENGFKYNDICVLFSNIKNIFLQVGDFENRTILHFNLKEPILVQKPTMNLQFFKKFTVAYHDTSKKEGEEMELIHEREEEEELNRINTEFFAFIERIEQETNLKVQLPEKGFLGVHSREAVQFLLTNECIVSINELPFFVLSFNDVEVVSFERITFATKTFDCVFVFKDKSKTPAALGSIEMTKLGYIKEIFDTNNIVFMENKVNINWSNLMHTIMEDPQSFYENGAWSELLREVEESESESEHTNESSSAYSYDEENEETTSYDEDESTASTSESTEGDESLIEEDTEEEEDDAYSEDETESSEDERSKKRKTRK